MAGAVSARLAVLIDAENAPLWAVEPLLAHIARYGNAQVKRAYGDWLALTSWKRTLLELPIRPVQVFATVKGKNAADVALAIDAMDLLHSGAVDGFALVSSDSDFTRLAERIREAGLAVYGLGEEKKTNPGLAAACDTFVFVETLAVAALPPPAAKPDHALVPAQASTPTPAPLKTASDSVESASSPAADTARTAVATVPKKKNEDGDRPGSAFHPGNDRRTAREYRAGRPAPRGGHDESQPRPCGPTCRPSGRPSGNIPRSS